MSTDGAFKKLRSFQVSILERLLRYIAVLALVPCLAGVALAIRFEVWAVAVADVAGWLGLVALASLSGLPYSVRATGLLAIFSSVGLVVLLAVGPYGAGLIWLLGVPALAGVLFDTRAFWAAEALILVVMALVAASQPLLPWGVPGPPFDWWVMAICSVVCVSLVVGLSTSSLMQRLQGAVADVEAKRQLVVATNDELKREVASRREVEEDRRQLQDQVVFAQKMEVVGQLAGGLAHNLNNLLTVVQIEGCMARETVGDQATLAEGLDNLLAATDSAASLCRDLLLFARPKAATRRPLPLDARLTASLPLLRSLAGERVRLVLDLDVPDLLVTAGEVEIEQVLTNLVANARDAMPHGGTLRLRTREVVDDEGHHVLIEVEDTGVGMDVTTQRRVFEPFFTTKTGVGSGLGLATVYVIVRSLEGRVAVHSAPERGSTFQIFLPVSVAQASSGPSGPPKPSRPTLRPGQTVLVVEDNATVRRVVERALEEAGCAVVAESNADDALETFQGMDTPPSLVLTDVLMPGRTGVDLARELVRHTPRMPVIAMTGWLGDDDLALGLQRLRVPILRKPFSPGELLQMVAKRLLADEMLSHR
ncbi:MAG: ATP-binding protein [Myxococcota bacterium]